MEGKESNIGTPLYWELLSAYTVFAGLDGQDDLPFQTALRRMASKIHAVLRELENDLERNREHLSELTTEEKEGLLTVTRNVSGVLDFLHEHSFSAQSIETLLRNAAFPSFPSSSSFASPFGFGGDSFMDSTRHTIDLRKTEPRMSSFPGYRLGSPEHREHLLETAFGRAFAKECRFGGSNTPMDIIRAQVRRMAWMLDDGLRAARQNHDYILFDTRERIKRVVDTDWGRFYPGGLIFGLDARLSGLQRLEDFQNRIIEIDCTGPEYAVEAKLTWEDGKNVLRLTAHVRFVYSEEAINKQVEIITNAGLPSSFSSELVLRKQYTLEGFKAWGNVDNTGCYKVFGAQEVVVEVHVSEAHSADNAVIVHLDAAVSAFNNRPMSWGGVGLFDWASNAPKVMWLGAEIVDGILLTKNKFATMKGKGISFTRQDVSEYFYSERKRLLTTVAKHEFGHSLGLGDAYTTPGQVLYPLKDDLSQYSDWVEGSVMDHYGPVTNNDIEMVILAFSTGQRQNFHKQFPWNVVSQALGQGN